ncbi:hypothetical protein AXG93_1544s1200 [Marchantia polymorpha subsp. ruderalis]|uniref:Ribosomal protein S6 n=1 Tax=Marchantia polymorpha subsp. ruderalis TaxID=1480154 RepID=A0A176VQB1_MARPO|nr:hypothetical protein AXG93_1544s1200 [Marchantia polymorpha subsp. ruderalis]
MALAVQGVAQGAVLSGFSCTRSAAAGYGSSAVFVASPVVKSVVKNAGLRLQRPYGAVLSVKAVAMQDYLTGTVEEEDSDGIDEMMGLGQRELREYPPGLQRYETMAVLRPDISEEQRLELTQRYEEAIIAGGGLDVEMFNRGMQPLAYNIKTKNMGGASNRYLDGIYLLFTYVTKPESQSALQKKLNADDDIIRSTTFRLKV